MAKVLLDEYITVFGCPDAIHSDQGTEFKNQVWHDICDRLNIK